MAQVHPKRLAFVEAALREALLDVVWSNAEIPRAMKGVALPGSAAATYSQARGRERVVLGLGLRPRWPAPAATPAQAIAQAQDFGGRPIERSARSEFEFLRSHALRQYGHLVYSDADMPELAGSCRLEGSDPAVFGLLEAIRVEARIGIALGRSFDWTPWHGASEAEALPEAQRPLFHWLREGRADPERMDPERAPQWLAFHDRLVGASGSAEVIAMAKEWVREVFPKPAPKPQSEQGPSSDEQGGQPSPGPSSGAPSPEGGESPDGKGEPDAQSSASALDEGGQSSKPQGQGGAAGEASSTEGAAGEDDAKPSGERARADQRDARASSAPDRHPQPSAGSGADEGSSPKDGAAEKAGSQSSEQPQHGQASKPGPGAQKDRPSTAGSTPEDNDARGPSLADGAEPGPERRPGAPAGAAPKADPAGARAAQAQGEPADRAQEAALPKERQPGKRVGAQGSPDAAHAEAAGSPSGEASDKPASSPNPSAGGLLGAMMERILAGQGPEALDAQDGASRGASFVAPPSASEAEALRGHGFSEASGDGSGSPKDDPSAWNAIPEKPDLLAGSTDLFSRHFHERGALDEELAARARRVLERMLTGQSRTVLSDSPAKRMSIRHMAQGGDAKFIRKEDFTRGAMAIDLVVDCSGSMRGQPMESAKALVLALSQLAAKGLVAGRVVFSCGEGWMACPLPMKAEKIARIKAFSGSEGIEPALNQNARKLRTADAVFVFTDAQITDKAFCKKDLKTRKVEPMGLYVGSDDARAKMEEYFDRHLIRPSLEDLCSAMAQRFLSQKKLVQATQIKKARLRR